MTSPFDTGRGAFALLRQMILADEELRLDVERCLDLVLSRYNTQIYENRFIVGGVVERIIGAAFVSLGESSAQTGVHVTRTDIQVGDAKLSVKGSFRPKPISIRLVNVMGESTGAQWSESTIFVVSETGIGYADPGLLPGVTRRSKDAILLPVKPLRDLWEQRPELVCPIRVPFSRQSMHGSDIASRIVADEILRYARRLRPFDRRTHEE